MAKTDFWYCICGRGYRVEDLKLPTECDCPCHPKKEKSDG